MERSRQDRDLKSPGGQDTPLEDGGDRRPRDAAARAAAMPASGAPVQHAFAGAELAAESRAGGASETDEAIARVAGNDRRV